jgi:hypothetical protein
MATKRVKPGKKRTPNQKFGRQKAVPFKDVVERLLQTPPDKKR